MVKFNIEEIQPIMSNQDNIRNMSVIAHVDHGKTTLCDNLLLKAGIISEKAAGNARTLDDNKISIERGITIKTSGVSLHYKYDANHEGNLQDYLINMIDSPGHVDFSSEVTTALRVTDGALVVVDCMEGVCAQTETVLRQAMQEKIKPVLLLNKIDRIVDFDGEDIYKFFIVAIDKVNAITSGFDSQEIGDIELSPTKGNVAFGAGKDKWGFTLTTFARFYAKKLGISVENMMEKLWGDNYYDAAEKKWVSDPEDTQSGKKLTRSFIEFVINPIKEIVNLARDGSLELIEAKLKKIGVELPKIDKELNSKEMTKSVLYNWLDLSDSILEMMILHLPSPRQAQAYRTPYLYEGPIDDECAQAMKKCDPKGPLMIYISKLIPEGERLFAFGRVFSGTISSGQKVKIMGPHYKPGTKEDVYFKNIQNLYVMMGKTAEYINSVPCGNTIAISGIDKYILKTGTVSDHDDAHTIRSMKYSVSPVVRVAVSPKSVADLPNLVKGLEKLSKLDPLVVCTMEETGENVIAGCGELHIEICLENLKEYARCEFNVSNPVVTYKETVTGSSEKPMTVKSQNKHNRMAATSETLSVELQEAIEKGEINLGQDAKSLGGVLTSQYSWDKESTLGIWCFGPENIGANCLVDQTKMVQYMKEVKDSFVSVFQTATRKGALIDENIRGLRVNLVDGELHSDSIHRGEGQIIPMGRRLFYASELAAEPTLYEPIFMCEVTCPNEVLGGVYNVMNRRRGSVVDEICEGSMTVVKCYIPIAESFGITESLRESAQGKAFPQCFFDHW